MMNHNYSYLNTANYLKNGLEKKCNSNYYTERAGMDGLIQISIRTVIIRAIPLSLSNQNSENYLEGTQINLGIAKVAG